jgi:formylmethanofuran dehydrogenase subunit C
MPLVLTPRPAAAPLAIDFTGVLPERLAAFDAAEIGRLGVLADGAVHPLGELFLVSGSAADGAIECVGDFSRVHRIAAALTAGLITVRGHAGRHAAEGMSGGRLVVGGDAGDWLAAGLTGGEVVVEGNAGDNVAAALPGDEVGMTGGVVVVNGGAGCLAGGRMRRGLLGIGGNCGPGAAFELRAGTVLVAGSMGPRPGLGMRRGSLIAAGSPPEIPGSFRPGACWTPGVLPLLWGRLVRAGFRPPQAPAPAALAGVWQQWHGDVLCGGRGEIFHRPAAAG